jgi:hypothetical protein
MKAIAFVRLCIAGALLFCLTPLAAGAPAQQLGSAAMPLDPQWTAWQDNFRIVMNNCVAKQEDSCLAKAFKDRPRPANDNSQSVAGELFYDLRTAMAMLAVPSAGSAIQREYGIDPDAYLGTGYSVPLTDGRITPYWRGTQREYLVPNLCAEAADPKVCPPDSDVRTRQVNAGKVKDVLEEDVATALKDLDSVISRVSKLPAAEDVPRVLVRFTFLNPSFYRGTFGRPGTKRVFFADYMQVRDKTVRDTMIATGAFKPKAPLDPNQDLFIWIYAPAGQTKAVPASWHALFEALQAE